MCGVCVCACASELEHGCVKKNLACTGGPNRKPKMGIPLRLRARVCAKCVLIHKIRRDNVCTAHPRVAAITRDALRRRKRGWGALVQTPFAPARRLSTKERRHVRSASFVAASHRGPFHKRGQRQKTRQSGGRRTRK